MISFLEIVLLVIIFGLGFWIYKLYQEKKEVGQDKSSGNAQDKLAEFNQKREAEMTKKKQEILNFLVGKEKVKNDDIQKLLAVSDATVTRYMDELEKEGKVSQIGKGSNAYYEKV